MTTEQFTVMALSFEGTISHPHFDRIAFKIKGKKSLQPCIRNSDRSIWY